MWIFSPILEMFSPFALFPGLYKFDTPTRFGKPAELVCGRCGCAAEPGVKSWTRGPSASPVIQELLGLPEPLAPRGQLESQPNRLCELSRSHDWCAP